MINPSELTIGNYVLNNGDLTMVCTITMEDVSIFLSDACQPIPLTKDVMKRCGAYIENNTADFHLKIFLEYNSDMDYWAFDYGKHESLAVRTLHQLQNLYFMLMGENLKYKHAQP